MRLSAPLFKLKQSGGVQPGSKAFGIFLLQEETQQHGVFDPRSVHQQDHRPPAWGSLPALCQPGCHPWGAMAVPTGAQCHWHCSEQVLPPCVVPVTGEEGKPAINEALSPGFQKGSFWIETAQERCCPLHIPVVARYCPAGTGDVLHIYL